jgi:hypothetical protein
MTEPTERDREMAYLIFPGWDRAHLEAAAKIIAEAREEERQRGEEQEMKVIQIAATSDTEYAYDTLFALCSDGSIWHLISPTMSSGVWTKLPDIPDDAEGREERSRK